MRVRPDGYRYFGSDSFRIEKLYDYLNLDLIIWTGGSLKAVGFGDGNSGKSHPQASLEAATQLPTDDLQIQV